MTLNNSHNAIVDIDIGAVISALFSLHGQPLQASTTVRIVGVIHIYVASLESASLIMLQNHVCLLQEAFIHLLYSIVERY